MLYEVITRLNPGAQTVFAIMADRNHVEVSHLLGEVLLTGVVLVSMTFHIIDQLAHLFQDVGQVFLDLRHGLSHTTRSMSISARRRKTAGC